MSYFKKFTAWHGVLLFIILLGIDQISKIYSEENLINTQFGIIHLIYLKNKGFIFGSFNDASELIRVVLLSTLGGYLVVFYFIIMYFLRNKDLHWLKLGITFFIIGIMGNVIDKTRLGYVIDFINLQLPYFKYYVFNIADVIQILGVSLIIYSMHKHYDEIWHPNNVRKTFLINVKYQLSVSLLFVLGLLLFCVTTTLFAFSFLQSYIDPKFELASNIYQNFYLGIALIFILYSLIAIFFVIIFTHRSVGPIKAFERFISHIKDDPDYKLKLRKGDFHQELTILAENVKKLAVDIRQESFKAQQETHQKYSQD